MRIVAIDTAGPVVGVALAIDGEVTQRIERIDRGTDTRLLPWCEELFAEAGMLASGLDGIAVAVGPGAFTGIRVGLATAMGLAMAIDRPLWGGCSLDSRAEAVRMFAASAGGEGCVLSLLDAKKSRVYASRYDVHAIGEALVRTHGPADVEVELALSWCVGPFLATGEGAMVYADVLRQGGGRLADRPGEPSVGVLARLGAAAMARGEGQDPWLVRPMYLRDADAKLAKSLV